jgi:hypothetical protein
VKQHYAANQKIAVGRIWDTAPDKDVIRIAPDTDLAWLVNHWNHLPPEVKMTIMTVARNVLMAP